MEPITIILVLSAVVTGFAAWKGLKGSSPVDPSSTASQQQVQAGASGLLQIGDQAQKISAGYEDQSKAASSAYAKNTIMAVGGAATTGALTAMTSAGGAAAGATIAGVTFGIGAAIGIAIMLWAKHEARIKGAKTENAGWNAIAAAFHSTLTGIFDSYNNGEINTAQTVAELQSLRELIKADGLKFNHMPGVNWSGGGTKGDSTQKYWSVTCDKHCTAGCCLYNGGIGPALNNAIALIQGKPYMGTGGNTPGDGRNMKIPALVASKYGFTGEPSFTIQKLR